MNLEDIKIEKMMPEDFFYETYVATFPDGKQYTMSVSSNLLDGLKGVTMIEEVKRWICDSVRLRSGDL